MNARAFVLFALLCAFAVAEDTLRLDEVHVAGSSHANVTLEIGNKVKRVGVSCIVADENQDLDARECAICIKFQSGAGDCDVQNEAKDASVLVATEDVDLHCFIALCPDEGFLNPMQLFISVSTEHDEYDGDDGVSLLVSASEVIELQDHMDATAGLQVGARKFYSIAADSNHDTTISISLCDSSFEVAQQLVRYSPRIMVDTLEYPMEYSCSCDMETVILYSSCYFQHPDTAVADFCSPAYLQLASTGDERIAVIDVARIETASVVTSSLTYHMYTWTSGPRNSTDNTADEDDEDFEWKSAPNISSALRESMKYAAYAVEHKQGSDYGAKIGIFSPCYLDQYSDKVSDWISGSDLEDAGYTITVEDFFKDESEWIEPPLVNIVLRTPADQMFAYQPTSAIIATGSDDSSSSSRISNSPINIAWYIVIPIFGVLLIIVLVATAAVLYSYLQRNRRAPEFSRLIN